MKAFVTGAAGFAGQHLVKHLLAKGYEVTGTFMSKNANALWVKKGVKYVYFDLNDSIDKLCEMLQEERPDEIYHLAAIAATNEADYEGYYQTNFYGTLKLYEAVLKSKVSPKILFVGSANVYGNVPVERQPIGEDEDLRPLNHYAVSKASADLLSYRYFCEGLHIVRARPFNHTGPGQTEKFVCPRIARQIAAIKDGHADKLRIGNVDVMRDFTDVRDVVEAYWMLLQEGKPGEAYNICSGKAYSVREIIDMLSEMSGVRVKYTREGNLVRKVDIPVLTGDYTKINRDTGWKPRYSFKETLQNLYESMANY